MHVSSWHKNQGHCLSSSFGSHVLVEAFGRRGIYKVATLPIAVLATGATTARLYQYWNPEGYAQWYLWNVAARRFKEPAYRRPWVDNAALMQIIREALREQGGGDDPAQRPADVRQDECRSQGVPRPGQGGLLCEPWRLQGQEERREEHRGLRGEQPDLEPDRHDSGLVPEPAVALLPSASARSGVDGTAGSLPGKAATPGARRGRDAGPCQRCRAAQWHPERVLCRFGVGQCGAGRERVCRGPALQSHDPHREAHESEVFSGPHRRRDAPVRPAALRRAVRPEGPRRDGVEGVRKWHKEQLEYGLELTKGGMEKEEKANRTGKAMIAAAEMSFGLPVRPFDKNTLELAQAGAAKIETVANELRASWASPLSGEVMKELVCDNAVVTVMKERVPEETFLKFEKVIEGRCPAVSKQPSQPVEERVF